ncbi:hypothetical protein ACIQVO_23285 [Streptomyces sp. NPDC101062]|uniref:hypothetical protein n=1 Tax=unclassified Streptomyces TaxID=2593676 RepID=UPI003806C753
MIYNFLTVRRSAPDAMAAALAQVVGVPVSEVDVADQEGDQEGRNWSALVLCGYEALIGDVGMAWEVSVSGAVLEPPGEAAAALLLADVTGATVLYPAQDGAPSTYWAVTAGGMLTRARVEDSEDDVPVTTVEALEDPVPELPGVRVELLPEIYQAESIAVPTTKAFEAVTDPDRIAHGPHPANRAREELMLWERLVRRMAGDWAPTGRYPLESYVEDLRTRDRIDVRLTTAPAELREPLARAAGELDAVFRAHTARDGGELLGRLTGSGSAVSDCGWWWHRRPVRLPWLRPEETGRPSARQA